MSGYVEAGYAVVGVTLTLYGTWVIRRSRSVAKALRPGQREPSEEPRRWR